MEKSATEYFQEYAEIEKKSKENLQALYTVELEILHIQHQIIELQKQKKELEIHRCKAAHTVRQEQIDLNQLKNLGFKARNAGL